MPDAYDTSAAAWANMCKSCVRWDTHVCMMHVIPVPLHKRAAIGAGSLKTLHAFSLRKSCVLVDLRLRYRHAGHVILPPFCRVQLLRPISIQRAKGNLTAVVHFPLDRLKF